MLKMRGITLLAAAAIVLAGCADNSPMVRSEKDVSYGDRSFVDAMVSLIMQKPAQPQRH